MRIGEKGKRLFACVLVVAILCGLFVFLNKKETNAGSNNGNERVEENSELVYYLKVGYDGIDRNGVSSDEGFGLDVWSSTIHVTDRIPDGLAFEGFVTTNSGAIGAYSKNDNTQTCAGNVFDDTREDSNAGVWDDEEANYYWHGLHYQKSNRTVSFDVKNLGIGCEIAVGIKTRTPTLDDDNLRMDFYNNANAIEKDANILSNTVHSWMARGVASTYRVTYQYIGDVPSNAPQLPEAAEYAEGANVAALNIGTVRGYDFSGWSSDGLTIENGVFAMPSHDVLLQGSFSEAQKHTLSYVVEGEKPSDYVTPSEAQYYAGDDVEIDSLANGDEIDDYVFSGWSVENIEVQDGAFKMPARAVVATGSFARKEWSVSYAYEGDVPEGAPSVPETRKYHRGDSVVIADAPTMSGYTFHGWNKENFVMGESDVVITGYFTKDSDYFSPGISIVITNPKEAFVKGDIVDFEITITNNENFAVSDVMIKEHLDGAEYVEGDSYEIRSSSVAKVPQIEPGESQKLRARFEVVKNETLHFENIVEILSANTNEEGYVFGGEDSKASVEFDTKRIGNVVTNLIEDISNPNTFDGVKRVVVIAVIVIACGAMIVVYKKASRNNRKLAHCGLAIFICAGVVSIAALTIIDAVSAAPHPVDEAIFTSANADYSANEPGSWQLTTTAQLVSEDEVELKNYFTTATVRSELSRDVLIMYGDTCTVRGGSKINDTESYRAYGYNALANSMIDDILELDDTNTIGVISYDADTSMHFYDFSRDAEALKESVSIIEGMSPHACVSSQFERAQSYDPIIKTAEDYLDQYYDASMNEGRELVVVYFSDEMGSLMEYKGPENKAEYEILKDKYPNITINTLVWSYRDGDYRVMSSDNVYVYDVRTDYGKIELSGTAIDSDLYNPRFKYDNIEVTQKLDTRYFELPDGGDTITWSLDGLLSGNDSNGRYPFESLSTTVKFKDGYDERDDYIYTVLSSTDVVTSVKNPDMSGNSLSEDVHNTDSPTVKTTYNITYNYNFPEGCSLPEGQSNIEKAKAFSRVVLREEATCEGWNFGSYEVKQADDIVSYGSAAFRMPEEDVVIDTYWTRPTIEKALTGTVLEASDAYLVDGSSFNKHVTANYTHSSYFLSQDIGYGGDGVRSIKSFTRVDNLPDDLDLNNPIYTISTEDSPIPVYMWAASSYYGCPDINGRTFGCADMYYYSAADKIYMNEDSSRMFYDFQVLDDISGVSDFDASKVKKMNDMFENSEKLTDFSPLLSWTTSSLENMEYMFNQTRATNLHGLENFDVTKTSSLSSAFSGMPELTNVEAISGWDVSRIKDMSWMFSGTGNFDTLSLSSWKTDSLESVASMFMDSNVASVEGLSAWNVEKLKDMGGMFSSSRVADLTGLSTWTTPSLNDIEYAFALTNKLESASGIDNLNLAGVDSLKSVFFKSGIKNTDALNKWDTSNVIEFGGAFESSAIENTNGLESWKLDSAVSLYSMFADTKKLDDLNGIGRWNVSSVENMQNIFKDSSITNVRALYKWNTSSVTNMTEAFANTEKLESPKGLDNWNITNLSTLNQIFASSGIKDVDGLGGWDTSHVEKLYKTFAYTEHLENLDDIASWNTDSLISLPGAFLRTRSLVSLEPLANWSPKIQNGEEALSYTFSGCGATSLAGLENFDVTNADTLTYTFSYMSNLKTLGGVVDDGNGDTKKIGLKAWETKTGNISKYDGVFREDTALEDVSAITESDWQRPSGLSLGTGHNIDGVPETAIGYYDFQWILK